MIVATVLPHGGLTAKRRPTTGPRVVLNRYGDRRAAFTRQNLRLRAHLNAVSVCFVVCFVQFPFTNFYLDFVPSTTNCLRIVSLAF